MPPRGYRSGSKKPLIQVQTKTAVDKAVDAAANRIADMVRGHLSGNIPAAPSGLKDNPNLRAQKIPAGFEALDVVPSFAGGHPEMDKDLHHAMRLTGTNHVFLSRTKLTDKQLQAVTADYQKALGAIGHKFPDGIAMRVPSSRESIPKRAHAWATMTGGKTRVFHLRPSFARNAQEDKRFEEAKQLREANIRYYEKYGDTSARYALGGATMPGNEVKGPPDPASFGWNMPISEIRGNFRASVMVHEMGHNLDDINRHTGSAHAKGNSGGGHWAIQKKGLSRYGQTQLIEGYAEAAAQYFLGGKGSSKAADSYARVYGWGPSVVVPMPPLEMPLEGVPA